MTADWTPEQRAAFDARRRQRNTAIGLTLAALVVLFYGITVVRMAPGINARPASPAVAPAAAAPATPAATPAAPGAAR